MKELEDFKREVFDVKSYPDWVSDDAIYTLHEKLIDAVKEIEFSLRNGKNSSFGCKEYEEILQFYMPGINCFKSRSKDMEYCWNKIESLTFESLESFMSKKEWLAHAILSSFPPIDEKQKTKGESIDWKAKTINALKNAKDYILDTPSGMNAWEKNFQYPSLDDPSYQKFFDKSVPSIFRKAVKEGGYLPKPEYIIDFMISLISNTDYDVKFYGGNINGEHAKRTYFINSLTCALLQQTGKPCRRLVAITTSIAFDCTLSENDISKKARELNPNKHHPIADPGHIATMRLIRKRLDMAQRRLNNS